MLVQAHRLPAWIFSTCRVISALAVDLRISHLMSAQRGSSTGGSCPHWRANSALPRHELMDRGRPDLWFIPYTARSMDLGRFSCRVSSSSSMCQVHLEFVEVMYHVLPIADCLLRQSDACRKCQPRSSSNGDEVNSCWTSPVGLWRRLCGFRTPWSLTFCDIWHISISRTSTTMNGGWFC